MNKISPKKNTNFFSYLTQIEVKREKKNKENDEIKT